MLRLFALKYIFSKKNTKAINIISWVSIIAIMVGTAALIIVLSVFNGIDDFIKKQYTNFYTDISITPITGKTFEPNVDFITALNSNTNINKYCYVLQENVLATHNNIQAFITLRGVDTNYEALTHFSKTIFTGDTNVFTTNAKQLVLGQTLCNTLQISEQSLEPLIVYAFNKDGNLNLAPQDAVKEVPIYVSGVFSVQKEFDSKYAITSLQNMQDLLQLPNAISSIELQLAKNIDADECIENLQLILLKNNLKASTRLQQNKTLYYVLKSEKWMVYAVMSLLLLIASFNMIGSLSMLVLEKQKDICLLKAIGGTDNFIKKIFISTGLSIATIGAILGVAIALIVCILQLKFGFIKMGEQNLILNAYPIKILVADIILVFVTVIIIGYIASYLPSTKASKQKLLQGLH